MPAMTANTAAMRSMPRRRPAPSTRAQSATRGEEVGDVFEVVDELVTDGRVVDVGEVRHHERPHKCDRSDDRRRPVPRPAHGMRASADPQRHRAVREQCVDRTRQDEEGRGDHDHHDVLHHVAR